MRTRPYALLHAALLGTALALAGCGGGGEPEPVGPGPAVGLVVQDFSLPDANVNSPTIGQLVSPRGRLGSASAWYFGHAT